jgi:hypothetical protein
MRTCAPSLRVFPANAGTHSVIRFIAGAEAFLLLRSRWLWVPAFAGTT